MFHPWKIWKMRKRLSLVNGSVLRKGKSQAKTMDLPGTHNIREDPLYMPLNYFWEIYGVLPLKSIQRPWNRAWELDLSQYHLRSCIRINGGIQCRAMRSTANQLLKPLKFRSISSSQPCRQSRQTYAKYDKMRSTHTYIYINTLVLYYTEIVGS